MRRRLYQIVPVFAITLAFTSLALAVPVAAAHAIKLTGHAFIGASQIFDLDTGHLSPPGTADIYYENTDGTHVFLVTTGGSKDRKMGTTKPSYATCSSATLASHMTPMEQVPDGTYFCWKTSGRRFARIRVLSHSVNQVEISYTTWTR